MFIIRIFIGVFTGLSTSLVVILSLLAIPGIALLFWSADQTAHPPTASTHSWCQFGVYDFLNHYWEPAVDGKFPQFDKHAYVRESYAVRIVITNDPSSVEIWPNDVPDVTFQPGGTPWQISDNQAGDNGEPEWQGLISTSEGPAIFPGGGATVFVSISNTTTDMTPPTGCSVSF